jgi:hypothetical protein
VLFGFWLSTVLIGLDPGRNEPKFDSIASKNLMFCCACSSISLRAELPALATAAA